MHIQTQTSSPSTEQPNSGAVIQNFKAEKQSHLTASCEKDLDLSIYTDEGDKVTLSYDAKTKANYLSYENLAWQKGALSWEKNREFSYSSSKSFSLTVDGDLNKQELMDIKKVLKGIDKILRDFMAEDMKHLLKDTEKIQNLDTIAGVEAQYSYEKQLFIEQKAKIEVQAALTDPKEQPHKAIAMYKSPLARVLAKIDKVSDKMQEVLTASDEKLPDVLDAVNNLFSGYLNDEQADQPAKEIEYNLISMVQKDFNQKVDWMFNISAIA